MSAPNRNEFLQEAAGARSAGATIGRRDGYSLRNYVLRHLQTFFYALGQLSRRPFATAMTAAVIGIALSLPAGLHILLQNLQQVLSGWDDAAKVSVFMEKDTREVEALSLAERLRRRPDVAEVVYISKEQAMEEFRRLSGFGDALNALDENPLPAVLIVRPTVLNSTAEGLERFIVELRAERGVEMAQLDMQWVKRLYGIMEIGERSIWVLASMLALAVLLVVGNTIRLGIQNRRDEIVVIKLIGGTDAFIRRPFLYTGFWYGLLGAGVAVALVTAALALLKEPVRNLAGLYDSTFRLAGLDLATFSALLATGTLLGLAGSWLAVGRHLRDIEPT